jgi:hypothetical protein
MDKVVQRILELKKEIQTPNIKLAIQKLQQSLCESNSKAITSEKKDKNNLANIDIENDISKVKDEDIEAFLFNRYNR